MGVEGFGNAHTAFTKTPSDNGEDYDLDVKARTGAAAGFAIAFGTLSIGYSQYRIIQTGLHIATDKNYVDNVSQQIATGATTYESLPYSDFATLSYGKGIGHNVGMQYHPWGEGSPIGVGVAVLNLGGTKLVADHVTTNSKEPTYDTKIQQFADDHGFVIERPDDIPELINVGISAGAGGESDDIGYVLASLDEHDIKKRGSSPGLAGGIETGFQLPDKLARLASIQMHFKKSKDTTYFVGFLGAGLMAGFKGTNERTYGLNVMFHAGTENLSFLKLNVQTYVQDVINAPDQGHVGTGGELALTWIL